MTLHDLQTLLSPTGQRALAAAVALAPTDATFLAAYERLRKAYDPALAKLAVAQAILRAKAAVKFPHAAMMVFEREALEQATSAVVAAHRARRFAKYGTVLDLGCGLGGDAMALAQAGCRVIAVERDPLRAALARANFAACDVSVQVLECDALTETLPDADAVFCDPARRAGGQRRLSIHDYQPEPQAVMARFPPDMPMAFKLAPGLAKSEMDDLAGELEFVSMNGELKECVWWRGAFATVHRRATLLPQGVELTSDDVVPEPPSGPLHAYLHDPDAAVERAGLVGLVAQSLNATSIDDAPAYLTTQSSVASPFTKSYRVHNSTRFDIKRVNAMLRALDIGRVTLHRKNSPENPAAVERGLKLTGTGHCHVFLTRLAGVSSAIVAESLE